MERGHRYPLKYEAEATEPAIEYLVIGLKSVISQWI
jgi:hypothetical protein